MRGGCEEPSTFPGFSVVLQSFPGHSFLFQLHPEQFSVRAKRLLPCLVRKFPQHERPVLPPNFELVPAHSTPGGTIKHRLVGAHRPISVKRKVDEELVFAIPQDIKRAAC